MKWFNKFIASVIVVVLPIICYRLGLEVLGGLVETPFDHFVCVLAGLSIMAVFIFLVAILRVFYKIILNYLNSKI